MLKWLLLICFSLCQAALQVQREFDGKQFLLEFTDQIKCFDPNDPEFGNEGVPFLIMEIQDKAEIVELGKTSHFSGKNIIGIARQLQREFGASSLNLTDTSFTLPCERNGKWCCDEALMDLRMTSVFIHGKSYYELLGAVAQDPEYQKAASFIHQLLLRDFLIELNSFSPSMVDLIKEITVSLELNIEGLQMGQLAHALYLAGKKNEYAHQLWHRFHDAFIGEKEKLFVAYLLQKPTEPLLRILRNEVGSLIDSDNDWNETRLITLYEKLNHFSHSPALFLQSRATNQCLRQTVMVNSLVHQHPKISALLALKDVSKQERKPTLIERWIVAKQKIRQTKRFTFFN